MKVNNKVSFDELDLKFLNDLPIIAEVISSTSTKITRVFQPIIGDIHELCNNNIPKGWELDKKKGENIFYPFTSEYGKDNINVLESFFQLKNYLTFVKRSGTKWINYIEVQFGFYYDESYENNKPYFYFLIYKDSSEKFGGKNYPLSFYNKIAPKFSEFKCNITHPELGHEYEQIEIEIDISSTEKIYNAYNLFKNEALLPYLNNLTKK